MTNINQAARDLGCERNQTRGWRNIMSTPLSKTEDENRNGRSQNKKWMRVVAVYMGKARVRMQQRPPPHTSTPSFSQGVIKTGVVYAYWALSVTSFFLSVSNLRCGVLLLFLLPACWPHPCCCGWRSLAMPIFVFKFWLPIAGQHLRLSHLNLLRGVNRVCYAVKMSD